MRKEMDSRGAICTVPAAVPSVFQRPPEASKKTRVPMRKKPSGTGPQDVPGHSTDRRRTCVPNSVPSLTQNCAPTALSSATKYSLPFAPTGAAPTMAYSPTLRVPTAVPSVT